MTSYLQEVPAAFLKSQGWPFQQRGQELVTRCPLCDDPDGKPEHFYIHVEKGIWKCHKCGESGNLYQLKKRLGLLSKNPNGNGGGIKSFAQAVGGVQRRRIHLRVMEKMHAALLGDQEALDYCLKERRWSLDAVKSVKVGLRQDRRGKWLAYPHWRKGEPLGVKYRILPACEEKFPSRFEREPGCESVLFNLDALDGQEEIILASGESDTIALLSLGFENVVGTPTGESSLPPAAVEALMKKSKVFVPYDNDVAGQKGAREVAKRIGLERTYLVRLPEGAKDANDFLVQGGTREEFQALLDAATQFDVPSVYSIPQALDKLEEQKTFGGWDQAEEMTSWPSVNRLIGKWEAGNLIVVSGPQGTGKTTWALNVVSHWAGKGFPALFYCLEMSISELVQHVLCAHYRLPEEGITPEVIAQARRQLADWPLYLGANPRITNTKEVAEMLRQAFRRYGLKLLVFDNLHMLARSVDHRSEEIGVITKTFKMLAMELEIPLILIAQPRKLEPGKVMTPWDLKDSVDIFSDADQIILLHREHIGADRDRNALAAVGADAGDNLDAMTLIRLAKARHRPSKDAVLFFAGAEHRFCQVQAAPDSKKTIPERDRGL